MIYVAIIPVWIWVPAVIFFPLWLIHRSLIVLGIKSLLLNAVLVMVVIQSVAAVSASIATHNYSISEIACALGYQGSRWTLVGLLGGLMSLPFLVSVWPQESGGKGSEFRTWAFMLFGFQLIVLACHFRSLLLCTV